VHVARSSVASNGQRLAPDDALTVDGGDIVVEQGNGGGGSGF